MRKYFARWSPYRIRKVHVELIGKNEIYRPCSKLAGIEGTRDMYNFLGVNAPKCDAATTTDGFQYAELDAEVLLKQEGGERLGCTEKARLAELGEVTVLKDTGRWRGVGSEESISGAQEVTVRKVTRKYRVKTRRASCFCCSCQISKYDECHVHRTYPALVPALMDGEVKETAIMDTGVAPVGVDQAEEITFPPRKAESTVSRVTGAQWQESDQTSARDLWENLRREEEPALVVNEGQFDDSL